MNMADCSQYTISTQNVYEMLNHEGLARDSRTQMSDNYDSQDDHWRFQRNKHSKRARISSTDVPLDEFNALSIDDKLSVMYADVRKVSEIEAKLDMCMNLNPRLEKTESLLTEHENRLKFLEYKSLELDTKSRRCNLIFEGFTERKAEDCAERIQNFLKDYLNFEWPISIERAYRMGAFQRGKKRSIFVTFINFSDVQEILRNAYLLQGHEYSINKDLPRAIALARKELWPTYKNLRRTSQNSKVILAFPAKIIKDGEIVIDRFPDWNQVLNPPVVKSADRSKSADCSKQSHRPMNEPRSDRQLGNARPTYSTNQSEPVDREATALQSRDQQLNPSRHHYTPEGGGRLTRTRAKSVSPRRSAEHRRVSSSPAGRINTPVPSQRSNISRPWDTDHNDYTNNTDGTYPNDATI